MRQIVAGKPAMHAVRASRVGCAPGVLEGRRFAAYGSGRASRAYIYLIVKVNATYCRTPLRGSWGAASRVVGRRFAALVIMQRCCSSATYNPRLCARRFAARSPSIVQRCCAALRARCAGIGSCAAVAARSSRCADRGRRCGAVAPLSPLRGASPGLAAVAARRRAPCPASTSVPGLDLESLYDFESRKI